MKNRKFKKIIILSITIPFIQTSLQCDTPGEKLYKNVWKKVSYYQKAKRAVKGDQSYYKNLCNSIEQAEENAPNTIAKKLVKTSTELFKNTINKKWKTKYQNQTRIKGIELCPNQKTTTNTINSNSSGLISAILKTTSEEHYDQIKENIDEKNWNANKKLFTRRKYRKQGGIWDSCPRPISRDFAKYIKTINPTNELWAKINKTIEIKPGDIITKANLHSRVGEKTGHTMLAISTPKYSKKWGKYIIYKIAVIDSSSEKNKTWIDTRKLLNNTGIGASYIFMLTDKNGKPVDFYRQEPSRPNPKMELLIGRVKEKPIMVECPVCTEEINLLDKESFPCPHSNLTHGFHKECIFEWVIDEKHHNCPICRRPFDRKTIEKIKSFEEDFEEDEEKPATD